MRLLVAHTERPDTDRRCTQCTAWPASVETRTDDVVCERCATANDTRCQGCQQVHRIDAECADCVTCDRCGALVGDDTAVEAADGETICDRCRHSSYWQCPTCDGWSQDGRGCENGCHDPDDCECDDCRHDTLADLVEEFDYKPEPIFHGTGPLFLGPEIELEAPIKRTEECAGIAQSYLGRLGYLKADGSLFNGFEIVTHPMSYRWAMAHFPWQMLTDLDRIGCTVNDGTGLHVHVSRAGFTSTCHAYRWIVFIYRNQRQVETLARRSGTSWAAFTADDRRAAKQYAKGAGSARYAAINTSNRDTFELRVFASSLNPVEVQAALGFAAASIEYTQDLTVAAIATGGGWSWPAFVSWLAERPDYAPLRQQLEALRCAC